MAARRQRDGQQLGGAFGIVEKQFVKITHAVENQGVRILGLDTEVLPHHRSLFGGGSGGCVHRRHCTETLCS